jgi:hypothetical protein
MNLNEMTDKPPGSTRRLDRQLESADRRPPIAGFAAANSVELPKSGGIWVRFAAFVHK